MTGEQPATAARQARAAAGVGDTGELSDRQLLSLFVTDGDESAFATLVRRHGPVVLAVCRRVLNQAHDVEDAFQATFLVLIRKAGSLRRPELLGNWLYGVAHRIARKARDGAALRRHHETEKAVRTPEGATPEEAWGDLRPILDEELLRLPEKYRLALVLCYLEGKTNEEAARQLGRPVGTVKGRLARARDLLRSRLVRRGVAISAALFALLLDRASAQAETVPPHLVEGTVKAGLAYAAAESVTGAASAKAVGLAEGFLRAVRLGRWALAAMVLLIIALTAAAAGSVAAHVLWHDGEGVPQGWRPCRPAETPPQP
jgi:RNA polymerase sigma factor (sigma-70 family)